MTCDSQVKKPKGIFYANKERVKDLKLLMFNHSDILINARIKNHIVRAFRFKNNAAFIELYDKKTETRTKFMKKLENFFFVREIYFYPKPKDSKIIGVIILSRFKTLLDIGVQYAIKCKGQFDKVPDLAWILFGTPFRKLPDSPSQEKIKDLQTILTRYQNLVDDGYFMEDILKAFTSKKPVTSIELSNINPKVVNQLQKELGKYFFIGQGFSDPDDYGFSGELFVSLYKDLVDIMTHYSNNNFGKYDLFAGLAGVMLLDFLKFPPQKIAFYCFDERLKALNIIK